MPLELRRAPIKRKVDQLKAASDGYALSRKEISLVLRSAVAAKLDNKTGSATREAIDAYLKNVLGDGLFSQLFSEDEWKTTKVEGSSSYIAQLRTAMASLRQSLGN